MIVKPGLTGVGCVHSPVVLLEPPLAARPELMSRVDEVECKDILILARIQRIHIELGMSQPTCTDAAPK